MTDPIRWLQGGSEATSPERQLLDAGQRDQLPAPEQDAIWQALQQRLPPTSPASPPAAPAPPPPLAPATSAAVLAPKALAVAMLLGGLAALTATTRTAGTAVSSAPPPSATLSLRPPASLPVVVPLAPASAPSPTSSPGSETSSPWSRGLVATADSAAALALPGETSDLALPAFPSSAAPARAHGTKVHPVGSWAVAPPSPELDSGPARAELTAVVPLSSALSTTAVASTAPARPVAARLTAELQALQGARLVLARGDGAQAVERLRAMEREFPAGSLATEREVLLIEALAIAGQRDEAHQRAQNLQQTSPQGLYRERLRVLRSP